jgi:uncharacterized protein YciI
MLIIELTYKKPLDEVNALLQQHRDFLDKYYGEKLFIASGPKHPRTGGIILSMSDQSTINKVLQEDPFYQNKVAEYRVIEFEPNRCSHEFEGILGSENSH